MLALETVVAFRRFFAVVALLHAFSCGRIGFEPLEKSAVIEDAGTVDARVSVDASGLRCPVGCNVAATSQPSCLCSDSRNWADALEHCESVGLTLMRIDSAAENAEVESLETIIWLGASDTAVEGEWRWSDGENFWLGAVSGSAVGGLYQQWDNAQPNNQDGAENCTEMEPNGNWNDTECDMANSFVCE